MAPSTYQPASDKDQPQPSIKDVNDCEQNPDSVHCKRLREEINTLNSTSKDFQKDLDTLTLVNRLLATSVNLQADVMMEKDVNGYDPDDLKAIMEFNPLTGINPFTKGYRFSFLNEEQDPRKIRDRLMNKETSREAIRDVFNYVDGTSGKFISPSYGKETTNPAMLTFQPY